VTTSSFDPNNVKKSTPTRAHPVLTNPHKDRIASTKEDSIKWDKENFSKGTMIYTDGSCIEDKIGASAVLYIDGIETDSLRLHLGTSSEHTVFEAELAGILLSSHLASSHPRVRNSINFSIDNQAAIKSLQNNSKQPAQYLIDEIHRSTSDLHQEELKRLRNHPNPNQRNDSSTTTASSDISFTWVAGHMKSIGNERADTEAKRGALDGSSSPNRLPPFLHQQLPTSISAIKQAIAADIKKQANTWWSNSPRFIRMNIIDPSLPLNKFLKLTSLLNRRQSSLLTQLRTGHIPLNKHLHTIQKSPSPNCPQPTCTNTTEDIHHLIFTCPHYIHARYHLTRSVAKRDLTLPNLLASKDNLPHTLTYLNNIGRFKHIFGDIAPV